MAVVKNMSILAAYLSSILAPMSGGSQLLEKEPDASGLLCHANSDYVHIPSWSFTLHQTPKVGYVAIQHQFEVLFIFFL